jgi:hypothetical protein
MSRTFLRLLTLAVLAVTIPVQGMASIMAGQCMVLGHHESGNSETHAHIDEAAKAHHSAHSKHVDASLFSDADEGANASHCAPCTACCASVSIAPSNGFGLPESSAYTAHLFSPLPPLGIQSDGLYRPPLSL